MREMYKSLKLYKGYIEYKIKNPHQNFNNYLEYLLKNKNKSNNYEIVKLRIYNIEFTKINKSIISQPSFTLIKPKNMKTEDVYKVISFVYNNLIFNKTNRLINNLEIILTRWFNFEYDDSQNDENIVNLFITNDPLNFIYSSYYEQYFNWIEENITYEEVINIYKEINPEIAKKLEKNYSYKPLKYSKIE